MKYIMGMDVGGTTARLKLADITGELLGQYECAGITSYVAVYSQRLEHYRLLILPALKKHALTAADCAGLCAGASGVDTPQLHAEYTRMFSELGFPREVTRVYNDCEVFLHTDTGTGMVITAGTGSIITGKCSDGSIVRYGGWGHLISDEGSAFDLALQALSTAVRVLDGSQSGEALAKLVCAQGGFTHPQQIADFVKENIFNKSEISRYASLVERAAAMGDREAVRIVHQGAEALCHGAETVAEKLRKDNLSEPLTIQLWGSVLVHCEPLAACLKQRLTAELSNITILYPALTALDSALQIAGYVARQCL